MQPLAESLHVFQRLAQADPTNTDLQRDVSVSQNHGGEVLLRQGDLAGALAAFEEWQRDVSYTLTLLAELYDETGKQAKALEFAQKSLAISERLALLDRSNATSKKYADLIRALVARLGG